MSRAFSRRALSFLTGSVFLLTFTGCNASAPGKAPATGADLLRHTLTLFARQGA